MSERDQLPQEQLTIASAEELLRPTTRRRFVRMLGVGGTIVMLPSVFAACDDDDPPTGNQSPPPPPPPGVSVSFDLRTDIGIFRFAHTLEQLEALFYTAVVANAQFNALFNATEREILTDIRNHEVVHREFFRTALGGQAVPDLSGAINTTTLNTILSSKANTLNTARQFEDLGVAAYNGAGKYLQDARNLLVAGKIVSVEARHAAVIRDLMPPAGANANTAFAGDDVVDVATGRDVKLEAGAVLSRVAATNILRAGTSVTISNAPTANQGVPTATPDFFPTNP